MNKQDEYLEQLLRAAGGDAVAQDGAKEEGAEDAEDAAHDRANEPLEAQRSHPELEDDHERRRPRPRRWLQSRD
jgi:hypothetical protein